MPSSTSPTSGWTRQRLLQRRDVIGPLSTAPFLWSTPVGRWYSPRGPLGVLSPGSLASQAVGPPESFEEMSFAGRQFPDIGREDAAGTLGLLLIPLQRGPEHAAADQTRRPLQFQLVDDTDSHFSPLLAGVNIDEPGATNGLDITFPMAALAAQSPFFRGPDGVFGTVDDPQVVPAGQNMPMYQALIQIAFQPRWWNAPATAVIDPFSAYPSSSLSTAIP